jgi:epoxyqueuosine reductase
MDSYSLTSSIKSKAFELGFSACGIAPAEHLEREEQALRDRLARGYHATLDYLARGIEKRSDPRMLKEGARSVVALLANYYPAVDLTGNSRYGIAKFAYGKAYHKVIGAKLRELARVIKNSGEDTDPGLFVDSGTMFEKAWAQRCGLGWIGKNTLLVNRDMGSFTYIGVIFTTAQLEYDEPATDHCGDCTRCLEACPTGALVAPRTLDAGKCISYLTREYPGDLPDYLKGHMTFIRGCDHCQDACPYNHSCVPATEPAFSPPQELLNMRDEDWENLDRETFLRLFSTTTLGDIKFDRLRRNIDFIHGGQASR